MTNMFHDGANFSGIADIPSLKIDKMVQKTFIEVNEAGSEAVAAVRGEFLFIFLLLLLRKKDIIFLTL